MMVNQGRSIQVWREAVFPFCCVLSCAASHKARATAKTALWRGIIGFFPLTHLRSRQLLPTPCHVQPKLTINFVVGCICEGATLIYLLLEKFGCLTHCNTKTKMPRS
jgi:hypothetical protein